MISEKSIVEAIARMNIEQRDTMVKELVEKWPDMANSISNMITLESMVQNQKQQEDVREELAWEAKHGYRRKLNTCDYYTSNRGCKV